MNDPNSKNEKFNLLLNKIENINTKMSNIFNTVKTDIKEEFVIFNKDINEKLDKLESRISILENDNNNKKRSKSSIIKKPINNNNIKFEPNKKEDNIDNEIDKDNNANELENIYNNKCNKTNIKKRGKYKKYKNKSDIEKSIQYYILKKDDKYCRFSLSSFNKSNNTGYYYCSDTSCKAKGLIKFEIDLDHEYESKDKEIEKFVITKDHSFDFEEHSYQKYKQVLEDINNKPKNEIIKKLSKLIECKSVEYKYYFNKTDNNKRICFKYDYDCPISYNYMDQNSNECSNYIYSLYEDLTNPTQPM